MAELKISEMAAASQSEMTDGTLIETSIEDSGSSTGYSTRKGLLAQVANYILNTFRGLSLGGSARTVKEAVDDIQEGKVSKTGDTMTGTLIVKKNNAGDALFYRLEGVESDDSPSSSKYFSIARAWTRADETSDWRIGGSLWYYQSSTGNGLMLEGGRYITALGQSKYNGLRLTVAPDGKALVQFSGDSVVPAWRTALGLQNVAAGPGWNSPISISDVIVAGGHVTNGSKQMCFLIPYNVIGGSATLNSLSLIARGAQTAGVEYLRVRSGADGSVYTTLGTGAVSVWENGATKRTNEVESVVIGVKPRIGFQISVNFKYAICRDNAGTTAYNNTPIAIRCNANITLS